MIYFIFVLLFFFNSGCVTVIKQLNPTNESKHGLVTAMDIPQEMVQSDCNFRFKSSTGKVYSISAKLFSKKPQILILPEGKYNIENISCQSSEIIKSIYSSSAPIISNLTISNEKITVALPIKFELKEGSMKIMQDNSLEKDFFTELANDLSTKQKLYSAYDESILTTESLRIGTNSMVHIQSLDKGSNNYLATQLIQEIMECKKQEFQDHALVVGKRTLIFEPLKEFTKSITFIPMKKELYSNYSTKFDDCVINTLRNYKDKIRDRITLNY